MQNPEKLTTSIALEMGREKKKWMGLNYILEKNQLDFLIGWVWQEDENRRNYSHLKCLAFD